MATYFGFSDECGDYKQSMTSKQLLNHPFYVRSTLLINSSEWKKLSAGFKTLKAKYGIPLSIEVKWATIWSLRHYQINGKSIPTKHYLKPFEKISYKDLISFAEEALALIGTLKEKKIIISYTKNIACPAINEKDLLSFHLQEHMQRIEMEIQNSDDNLAVLFFDPVSHEKNEYFRELYNDLFEKGDFIKYSHIKDSLNIENSHHSVGIQLADYISGAFSSIVKSGGAVNYSTGVKMYFDSVHPYLRRNRSLIHGYGLREVPRDNSVRGWLRTQLTSLTIP